MLSRAAVNEAKVRARDDTGALTTDLGATYLVEGSVQESNGMLRVSLHLVRSNRSVAWGDIIEGKFEAIFELQSKLALALSNALVARVSASELERVNAQPTSSPQALSAYWLGKALLERADVKGNVDAAVAAFDQAARLDAKFALAHTGLAEACAKDTWRLAMTRAEGSRGSHQRVSPRRSRGGAASWTLQGAGHL